MSFRRDTPERRARRLAHHALAGVPSDELRKSERLARLADIDAAPRKVSYFRLDLPPVDSANVRLRSDGRQANAEERAAASAFAETPRRINIIDPYITPAIRDEAGNIVRRSGSEHFQDLLDSSHRGGAYFLTRVQELIIRQHLIPSENRHHIEIGAANGEIPALIAKLNGIADRYSFIDIVDEYLDNTAKRLMKMGVPAGAIAKYHADYTDSRFWKEIWDTYIDANDGRPKSIHCYGNTLNNESLLVFLQNLRPRLRDRDTVYIGVDSTLDAQLLVRAYEELAAWLKNGTHFTIERSLDLVGFNLDLLKLVPGISREGHRTRVHFDMFNMVQQELFARGATRAPNIVLKAGEKIDCGYSDRYARDHYLEIFKQAGFRALSDAELDKPFTLKCDTEDYRIDYNVWRLIPVNG